MAAYVVHTFEKGFLLDEARLRKVRDLVEARIKKYPTPLSLSYKVFRGDSYAYETSSLEDVAKEDNEDWRAITRLQLVAAQADVFDFKLSFSDQGVRLEIVGDDRDGVFLLFSDLREYLQNEVLMARTLSQTAGRALGLLTMFLLLIGFLYTTLSNVARDPQQVANAIATRDVIEKLNFLIEERRRAGDVIGFIGWLVGILIAAVFTVGGGVSWVWGIVFPANLFLFGKRQEAFAKRRKVLSNVFWIVVISLAVSTAAGFVVWFVTTP